MELYPQRTHMCDDLRVRIELRLSCVSFEISLHDCAVPAQ